MNYLRLLPRVIAKIRQNPKFLGEIAAYAQNDLSSLLGRHHYPNKIIFIAGLPKAGTTWVETQLANVPGYNLRPVVEHKGVVTEHNINDRVFSDLPTYGYSILKLHTRCTDQNLAVIRRHVPRFMIMIRDLRDMCISAYFHVRHQPDHADFERYNRLSEAEGLMHRIGITAESYIPWIRDALHVAKNDPEHVLLVRYEDLNENPDIQFRRIFGFFGLPVTEELIRSLEASKIKKDLDIGKVRAESVGLRMKSTARKGIVGDWQNHFAAEHKIKFKDLCGPILVESGYETDDKW
jgi:hypothetical protein